MSGLEMDRSGVPRSSDRAAGGSRRFSNSDEDDDVVLGADPSSSVFRRDLRERLRERELKLVDLIRASQATSRMSGGAATTSSNRLLDASAPRSSNARSVEDEEAGANRQIGSSFRRPSRYLDDRQQPSLSPSPRARTSVTLSDLDRGSIEDNISGIERVSSRQTTRIRELEGELAMKNVEVDELRNELVRKLERLVSLELELENRQFSLEGPGNGDELDAADYEAANRLTPEQTQVFFSQLLRDLRDLEELYKEERLKSSALQEELRLENEFLQNDVSRRIAKVDERLQKADEERTRLRSTIVDKDMEIDYLKRALADLRLNAITEGNDEFFGDSDAELLRSSIGSNISEDRNASMRQVRREQEEAVERAKRTYGDRASVRPRATSGRAGRVAEDLDDGVDSLNDLDIDSVIAEPTVRASNYSGTASPERRSVLRDQALAIDRAKASSSRRLSGRFLDEDIPVYKEPYYSEDEISGADFDPAGRSYYASLSPSRQRVKREQSLAIDRARTSSIRNVRTPLTVTSPALEEPMVDAENKRTDRGRSSNSNQSRRAVEREQERQVQRAKRGFFGRLTRVGRAQLIEL